MRATTRRLVMTAAVLSMLAATRSSALAQQGLPTAEQAQSMLSGSPTAVAQLQRRIAASGLTPAQVRARLKASGYPEGLLDPYLQTEGAAAPPTEGVLGAARALGLLSVEEADGVLADPTGGGQRAAATTSAGRGGAPDARLPLFGLNVFQAATSQFQPALAGPVDAGYRLGPGDVLVLILTGDVEVAHTLEVTREGFVVIPQVGQLFVNNLTLGQLNEVMYERLARVYSGVRRDESATTKFQVTVARLRTVQVFVVGDVARPGSFQLSSAGTVLTALYAAGGPTENGNFRAVEVRRGGRMVATLDLYSYLLRGENRTDIRLETGDVVFVGPRGNRVAITGQVVRPAIYELRPDETLQDVIAFAGGFDAAALRRRLQITRILPSAQQQPGRERVVLDLGEGELAGGVAPRLPMQAGDSVAVFAVADRRRGFVTVQGNVWTPGRLGITPGMRLQEAIRMAGGPKPDVYLSQILVSRLRPDSTRVQLRSAFRDSSGAIAADQNLPLQEDDEVTVFSRTTFRPQRYVAVAGAVRTPGRISYREGMTLRDAVLEAGGLTEDAWLSEAEVARLPMDRTSGRLAQTFRPVLDSTYLFERDRDGAYGGPPGLPAPASGAPDFVLEPYDNVLILRQPDWSLERTVTLAGRVRYPGTYALQSRTERLLDILKRAGGLMDDAYPEGTAFIRPSRGEGRIGIDLPAVLRDSTFRDNLIMIGGDSVIIPEYNPVVRVLGSVNQPTAVAFVPGQSVDYYVSAAGGYTREADRGRAYVAQPNGKLESVKARFLLPDSKPEPRPGAVVTVPVKPPREKSDLLPTFGIIASITASLVASLSIIAQ